MSVIVNSHIIKDKVTGKAIFLVKNPMGEALENIQMGRLVVVRGADIIGFPISGRWLGVVLRNIELGIKRKVWSGWNV